MRRAGTTQHPVLGVWLPLSGTISLLFAFAVSQGGLCLADQHPTGLKTPHVAKSGLASWYSSADACPHNPDPRCPMTNGRSLYDQEATQPYFAASWDYPLGTRLLVGSALQRITVVVTDRGPARRLYRQGRLLDLSKAAFHALAPLEQGLVEVEITEVK